MKRHCKTGLPQPNVTWHTIFSEPAIPRPGQEWRNIEGNYQTRVSQVFPSIPSSALLVFALMLNGCPAQLGPPIRCPREGNTLCAFSTLCCSQPGWADHSWRLGALLRVADPFAVRSCHRGSRGPKQGTRGTWCQVLHETRERRCQRHGGPAQSLNKPRPSSSFLTAQSLQHRSPASRWGIAGVASWQLLWWEHHTEKKQWASFGPVCAQSRSLAREHFIATMRCSVLPSS